MPFTTIFFSPPGIIHYLITIAARWKIFVCLWLGVWPPTTCWVPWRQSPWYRRALARSVPCWRWLQSLWLSREDWISSLQCSAVWFASQWSKNNTHLFVIMHFELTPLSCPHLTTLCTVLKSFIIPTFTTCCAIPSCQSLRLHIVGSTLSHSHTRHHTSPLYTNQSFCFYTTHLPTLSLFTPHCHTLWHCHTGMSITQCIMHSLSNASSPTFIQSTFLPLIVASTLWL